MTAIAFGVTAVVLALIFTHAFHSTLKLQREKLNNEAAARLHETGLAATLGKKLETLQKEFEDHRRETKAFIANARMR